MKKITFFCLFLTISGSLSLLAQSPVVASCKTKNFTLSVSSKFGWRPIFTVTDSANNQTDTLFIQDYSWRDSDNIYCFCNDSLASFQKGDDHYVQKFQLKKGKWEYIGWTSLPTFSPMEAFYVNDHVYENYSNHLVSVDKVISDLTVSRFKSIELIPIEKYGIEYSIRPQSTDPILVKKTPVKL